ncbi:MAG: polysaccharide biosynthesis tyrosine autokinase [Candidatus Eisenbacteria bacterium]
MTQETEESHHDYLFVLYERMWIIILAFIGVVAATAYFTFTSPNVYEATATLMVDASGGRGGVLQFGYQPMGSNLIQNYCQVIKSRTVAAETAARLANDPDCPSRPANPVTADALLRSIAAEPVRGADMIRVTGSAPTAREAAIVTNTAVDVFIEQQVALLRGEFTEQRQFLEGQIPLIKDGLRESEDALKEFKEKHKFVALSEEARGVTSKLAEFDKLYGEVETDISTTSSRLDYLTEHFAEQKRTLPEDIAQVSSPYILELRKQLVNLETNYSMYLVQGLAEDHPKIVDLKKSIDEARTKLVEETRTLAAQGIPSLDPLSSAREVFDSITSLEAELVALKARKEALGLVRTTYARKLESLPSTELTLARLERERELNANTYQMLTEKHEEVKIAEAGKMSHISVVDRARVPASPVRPQKRRNLAFGAVVGLVLGLGGAFLLDYADSSVKTPLDVDKSGSLAILGSIPRIRTKTRKHDRSSGIISHLLTRQPARSPLAESYRTVRTNLQFTSPDRPVRTLLVTSALPGDGKSTVAANLAIAMAQMGLKTLLVDTDFRKPVLRKVFEVRQTDGLTEFLADKIRFENAVAKTRVENLTLLPAGALPPNPSELLGSRKMESLIERLKSEYDYVIFDSPPVLAVTDATVLGSKLDGTVVIVSAGRTDRMALKRTREILGRVRANVLGVIMHMVKPVSGRYAYYSNYYYYHSYYREDKTEKHEEREVVHSA